MTNDVNWKLVPELMPALLGRQKETVHTFSLGRRTMIIAFAGYGLKQYVIKIENGQVWVGVPRKKRWVFDTSLKISTSSDLFWQNHF